MQISNASDSAKKPHLASTNQFNFYKKILGNKLDNCGNISVKDLKDFFSKQGLYESSPHIAMQFKNYLGSEQILNIDQLNNLSDHVEIFNKAFHGSLAIKNFNAFCEEIIDIFNKTKKNKGGKVADYIPQLARVNPDKYAISICSADGQQFNYGDHHDDFCVQSCSKPITYSMAIEEMGLDNVHKHVGQEPSGRGFNSFVFDHMGRPHNPMINSGAIMCCSMIKPDLNSADRFDHILDTWNELTGGIKVGYHNSTYLSEKSTADRNFAIGHFMRENKVFPGKANLHDVLDLYFQICSISITSEAMSVLAATFANGGVCPRTSRRIFSPATVRSALSLIFSCGMYDYSGEFAFNLGMPAKSGVAGGLMVIVPNVMGVCIWSPRLDRLGNSVRGIDFCNELVNRFNLHIFDQLVPGLKKERSNHMLGKQTTTNILELTELYHAAACGDLNYVKRLVARGVDINKGDYDKRTALHLAVCENHLQVVKYLVEQGAHLDCVDRWNATPIKEAIKYKHKEIINYLKDNLPN